MAIFQWALDGVPIGIAVYDDRSLRARVIVDGTIFMVRLLDASIDDSIDSIEAALRSAMWKPVGKPPVPFWRIRRMQSA